MIIHSRKEALDVALENISNIHVVINSKVTKMYMFAGSCSKQKSGMFYEVIVNYKDEFDNIFHATFHVLPLNGMIAHWDVRHVKDEADILSAL